MPAAAVPWSRVLDLIKAKCQLFSTTFNPERLRTGNKILRQRLKGPAMLDYYPEKILRFKDLQKAYPNFNVYNEDFEEWQEKLELKKARGKGAPKKKRSAAESKKFNYKKKAQGI